MNTVTSVRNLGVLSVLLLGVSTLAHAGNYVPQNSYGGADVVVNMDVIGTNSGMARAPVLQQPLRPAMPSASVPYMAAPLPPLRPPVLQRPAAQQFAPPQAPIALRQPAPMQAPAPMMAAPMPRQAPSPIQSWDEAPRQAMAPQPQRLPSPPMDIVQPLPPVMPPQPITEQAASVPQPESKMAAFSTRELAASAPPIPSPIAEYAPDPAPIRQAKAEKKSEPKMDPAEFTEKAVIEETPATVASVKPPEQANAGRQLLAQAREKADTASAHEERKVVLFDNPPPAPSAEAPLKESAKKETKTAAVLKPAPIIEETIPAPVLKPTPLDEPKTAAATLKPVALPPPIKEEVVAAPMPLLPAEKTLAPAPLAPEEKVAMLTPAALPDVAPASIPNAAALKKAETVVDDFEAYRLLFSGNSAQLSATEQDVLSNIVGKLKQDENIKLQLRAYANGTPESSAQARRLSLARALAVRSYLTQAGIGASRMDVRALGMGSTAMNDTAARGNAPADRVDLIFTR